MRSSQRFFIGVSVLTSVFCVEVRSLLALNISTNQPIIRQTLAPGETVQGSIELVSHQTTPLRVKVYLEDWRYTSVGDGSKEFGPPKTLPRSCAEWVSVFPNELELPANGKKVVDYTIRVPEGASLNGGYVAVVFFEGSLGSSTQPTAMGQKASATVQFSARLGSLVFVDVKGTV